ncbi:MAG TPA: TRAP transporter small permease [Spirochaetales bacterium]|nr:TRAP transporter small permease [Spirochaetales bacterium]
MEQTMERVVKFLFDAFIPLILKIIGIVLTITILLQVFSRFIMIHPFTWTEELSRFAFIWFCFLGSVYALRRKLHLGIDYFYRKFSSRTRKVADIFINALILFFGYILVHFGYIMIGLTSMQLSTILRIPMSYMYAVLPITGFLFFLIGLYELINLFKKG